MDDVKYNHRLFYITSGIMLVLFSLSCCLNVTIVSRGISFPLYYLFGFGSYLLYAFFIVEGFSIMIKSKLYFPKSFLLNLGIILAAVGGILIYSTVLNFDKSADAIINGYNKIYFGDSQIFWKEPNTYFNLITNELGGGLFGSAYAYVFVKFVNIQLAMTVAIIIASVGVVLILFKPMVRLISHIRVKIRNTPRKPKEEKPVKKFKRMKKPKKNEEILDEFDSYVGTNIYAKARQVGHDEVNLNSEVSELRPANFEAREVPAPTIEFKQNIRETGVITRPKFSLGEEDMDETAFVPEPEPEEEYVEEVSMPLPVSQPEPVVTREEPVVTNREEHHEQMNLNFDAPREFDESLLGKQPEIAPLEEIPTPVPPVNPVPAPAPIVQPIAAEPIKKKPIKWVPPSTELLASYATQEAIATNTAVAEERKDLLNQIFTDFHIAASCTGYTIGPSITRFHIEYEAIGLVKDVAKLEQDISRRLNGVPVRFEATVPGYSYSGLEVPNGVVTVVSFKEVFEDLEDVKKHPFNVAFGKDITGKVVKADFNDFPHLLVSGTTGSGKSVFVNSIITTLIMRMSPSELRIVLVDPKRVEMNKYKDIPHLLCPVANEPKDAYVLMKRLVEEMEDRYRRFEIADCSTNVKEYNEYAEEHGIEKMYYILAVLDEYADLTDNCKELMGPVQSLTQKARAAGIHLMIATQRPSVNVITGTIKANLSTRVCLMAASSQDSMVVLDQGGAEDLLGNGDMLVKSPLVSRSGPARLQGCYIKGKEIAHVTAYLKEHYEVNYDPKFLNLEEKMEEGANELIGSEKFANDAADSDEEKYQAIKDYVMGLDYVSMSKIQRDCGVGFNRAGRVIRRLQEEGIVAPVAESAAKGNKVLVHDKFNENVDVVTSNEQEK